MDHYWESRGPLPLDISTCCRICGAVSKEEQDAVQQVISEYFVRMDDGHYHQRLQSEIERNAAISATRSKAGRLGGQANAKQMLSKCLANAKQMLPPGSKGTRKHGPDTGPVWIAYQQAYRERYGADPVRNAKVNGQLSKLVTRLGADEAPAVARAYLANRNALYVSAKHCTDLLLRDAEKLRTEWATGSVTYRRDAAEEDRLGATGAMWERVGERLKARGIE